METKRRKIGVLIGRFQVPYLHTGHIQLFDSVTKESDKVIVLLGTAHKSRDNALDFKTRKLMINQIYPNVTLQPIADRKDDMVWVKNLDKLIVSITDEKDEVTLYGGRDSFLSSYESVGGKYKSEFVKTDDGYSSTALRKECSKTTLATKDYRIGMISAEYKRYPIAFSTVDIIVEKMINDKLHILLGQKPADAEKDVWVFPGGFIDKGDGTGRGAAQRELKEETSLDVSTKLFEIFDQLEVPDWRYKDTEHTIFTTIYNVRISDGWQDYVINNKEKAGDDLHAVKWVAVEDMEKNLSDVHQGIWKSYKENKLEKEIDSTHKHTDHYLEVPNDFGVSGVKCGECGELIGQTRV